MPGTPVPAALCGAHGPLCSDCHLGFDSAAPCDTDVTQPVLSPFPNLGRNLDAVHDITVAYPHNIPQTERHLLRGDFPKEIYFYVHRYPIDTLPTAKEDLQLWCHKRWEEKEERLRCFYQGERDFRLTEPTTVPPCKSELRVLVVKFLSILYWTLLTPAVCLLMYLYSLVRWYFVITIVIFVLQERVFGGLEVMELACYRFLHKQSHSNAKRDE